MYESHSERSHMIKRHIFSPWTSSVMMKATNQLSVLRNIILISYLTVQVQGPQEIVDKNLITKSTASDIRPNIYLQNKDQILIHHIDWFVYLNDYFYSFEWIATKVNLYASMPPLSNI
jgi:hypothetical protein